MSRPVTPTQLAVLWKVRGGMTLKRYGYGNHSYYFSETNERVNAAVAAGLEARGLIEVAESSGIGMNKVCVMRVTEAGNQPQKVR